MNIKIYKNEELLNQHAAALIAQSLEKKPDLKMGMATGRTPIGLYKELINLYETGKADFKHAQMYNLDEYIGIPKDHPQSFYSFMENYLFQHINVDKKNLYIPNGNERNMDLECMRYNQVLSEIGQLDLQILGIGTNGHIGFNEPENKLIGGTHLVDLTYETRVANAKDFPSFEDVPTRAITMGVGDILRAKHIVFVAIGSEKAEIVREALQGPITTWCPGSMLQLHPNASILLDTDAARLLGN